MVTLTDEQAETLRATLRFYADEDAWQEMRSDEQAAVYDRQTGTPLGNDLGAKARAALLVMPGGA